MPRISAVSLSTLAALSVLASGCGRSDQTKTSSSSAGASTPTISGSTEPSKDTAPSTATVPVTYANAESSFTKGDYSTATQLFSRYTDSNPENPWGFYMLGMSAWKNGEQEQAVAAFDRALQLDPDHRKSLFNSSRVLLEMGQPQEALKRVEQALGREPMSNEGLRLLGRARYQVGKVNEAIEAYRKALAVDESDVWSMNNLALIYLDQNRSEEAIPPLARAIELRANAPVFQNNLGMALERSGYPTAAAKAYETAIALDSTYRKASVGLGRVTSGGQTPEKTPVDLASLSQRFQDEIAGWRAESSTDSVETQVIDSSAVEVTDSSTTLGLSDSTHSSLEAVSDTVEDCQHEE
jgi:tetratricopeptide (TPR) repeat protein